MSLVTTLQDEGCDDAGWVEGEEAMDSEKARKSSRSSLGKDIDNNSAEDSRRYGE